jgi:hypothetical protein
MTLRYKLILCGALLLLVALGYVMIGDGGFRRVVTISGIYPILRPGGYDVVCFADSDSRDGGLSCLPCSVAGCETKRKP